MADTTPLAFLSYARHVDLNDGGELQDFADRLSKEVHSRTGKPFSIFVDRHEIRWGQRWQERIVNGLDSTSFLIPVITAGYFLSEQCRAEFERFHARTRSLGRTDLILPLYYIECDQMERRLTATEDSIVSIVQQIQYVDWRRLRFEPWEAPKKKALAELASAIVAALRELRPAAPSLSSPARATSQSPTVLDSGSVPRPAPARSIAVEDRLNELRDALRELLAIEKQLVDGKEQHGRNHRPLLEAVSDRFRTWKKRVRALGVSGVSRVEAAPRAFDEYDLLRDDIVRCVSLVQEQLTKAGDRQ